MPVNNSDSTDKKVNNSSTYDIAIVGGGMVGITLALLIVNSRPDWRIALLESFPIDNKKNSPKAQSSFDNRSTALAEGSRQILEDCGVWSNLKNTLTPIKKVHVSDRGHFSGSELTAEEYDKTALGYVVENPHLGEVLMQALQSHSTIDIHAPAKVNKLQAVEKGWQLNVDIKQENTYLDCALLILADGTESSLGKSVGINYGTKQYQQSAIIANVETDKPHTGIAYERFTDQGPIALLPLGFTDDSCRSALVWTQPDFAVDEVMTLNDHNFCQHLQKAFGLRAGHFHRVSTRFSYPLQLVVAKEQIRKSLVMMGNAAHFLHPVAGQGFNLALRDCQALVSAIKDSENPGDLSVLQKYLDQQTQDQKVTISLSHNLVKLFSTDALPSALVRSLGLIGLDFSPPAKQLFAQQAMGFSLPTMVNQR